MHSRSRSCGILLLFVSRIGCADDSPSPGSAARSSVVRETVAGSISFPAGEDSWTRISGKAQVVNAYTLRFEDGTIVDLRFAIDAPELEQQGRIGDRFYPCGRDAAEFLRALIADRPVAFYVDEQPRPGHVPRGPCFVGETHVQQEMVRNGWAISQHSGMDAWEIIARENRRGLWRGEFVVPKRWRAGKRLGGESTAEPQAGCADPPAADNTETPQAKADPEREFIAGGLAHSQGRWLVVSGHVRVLNGYTIAFADGTEVALENGPELEQQGKIGDTFYPAGKEAVEFLKQLIGDRVVTMYVNADTDEYRRGDRTTGLCYVEETNLGYALIANGWAIAEHSLMVPAELIARLNKRGLWRGEFVRPDRWRAGERLSGEVAAVPNELPTKQAAAPDATVHERVMGSINHGGGDTVWRRVTGRVNVLDACTLEFPDGTRVELDLTIPHPDQMALNGDSLYACGREAGEFLRGITGNRPVMCFQNDADGPWSGYVGNTNIERAMVVNGWALADHSSLHADEIIARENLRGLWRGTFVHPDDWLAGVRLPGEPAPEPIADERQANTLLAEYGHSQAALAALIPRIIRDVPGIRRLTVPGGEFTDGHLTELMQLTSLEELNLDACGGITVTGLASLQKLPHLKRLVLPWRSTDAALESISGISTLEFLAFYFAEATDAGLVHLKRLQNLRHLCLHRASITDAGLAHLQKLPSLAVLEFGGIPISDGGVPHLAACDQVEYLDVSDTEITNAGAAQLARLARLRVLKLPERVTVDVRDRLQQALPALKFDGNPQDVFSNAEMN